MKKRIIITGATGLIGKKIASDLIKRGDEVIIFTRSPEKAKRIIPGAHDYVKWLSGQENGSGNVQGEIASNGTLLLEGADAVIHLAGENVMSHRWNEKHKKKVFESRINSTAALVDVIGKTKTSPAVFVCASAIGFYGTNAEGSVDESAHQGNDFLAYVTAEWEKESRKAEQFGVRCVNIRTGIVLDKNEGALAKMLTPFKLFLGGPIGSGKQWFPWIHVNDIAGIFIYALDNNNVTGAVNAVSPGVVTMKEFSSTLGKLLRRPSAFNVPVFALKLLYGEGAETITGGVKVIPKNILNAGYNFEFTEVNSALTEILTK